MFTFLSFLKTTSKCESQLNNISLHIKTQDFKGSDYTLGKAKISTTYYL